MGRQFSAAGISVAQAVNLPTACPSEATISCWFRVSSAASFERVVTWMGDGLNTVCGVILNYPSAGNCSNQTGGNYPNALPYAPYVVGRWNHVVVSYTATANYIWVNGVAGTPVTYSSFTPSTVSNLYFGYIPSTQFFTGITSTVGAWNVKLSDAEVSRLLAGAMPHDVARSKLLGEWYLPRERFGTTDREATGTAYNLTTYNTIYWGDDPPQTLQRRRRRVGAAAPTTKYWLFGGRSARIIGGGIGK